ncbi:MAG: orotate phosphoribosyltransferase [Candidatus Micrarchaeia archaeon]
MTASSREELATQMLELLKKKGALKIANSKNDFFKFKSGRMSPNFISIGALTDAESLVELKKLYSALVKNLLDTNQLEDFDFVFGPAYKGINLAALTCEGLYEYYGLNKRYLYDRKEIKEYGDKRDRMVVGAEYLKPGAKILVVDDVITTGEAKLVAFNKLKGFDHKIVGIVIGIDRQELNGNAEKVDEKSAVQNLQDKFNVKTHSIINMTQLFSLIKKKLPQDINQAWVEYYEKYGAVKLSPKQ